MHPKSSESEIQKKLIVTFLILGCAIRLFHFFYNRSLWMDEVYLSTSFVKMNFQDLISKPLFYQQKAPIGFLIAVKLIVNIFGYKEFFLRLIPLIAGLTAMFVFVPVVKYFLNGLGSALAIGIICLAPAMIYHSVEIKQYSTELLGTVLCLYLFIKFQNQKDFKSLMMWGVSGAVILWFSYSSIFILAAIAISIFCKLLFSGKIKPAMVTAFPFSIWFISFTINFLLFTHKHVESEWIVQWFRAYRNFVPFPPKSVADLQWFPINLYRMMDYPLGLLWNFNNIQSNKPLVIAAKMPFLPILFLIAGIYQSIKRKRTYTSIFILAITLTFIASGLELYPLTERFWLFIAPVFVVFIGEGFNTGAQKFKNPSIKYFLFSLVIFGPIFQAIASTAEPQSFYASKKSYEKEVLLYVSKNYKAGDAVYVYWNNLPGYRLYQQIYPLKYTAIEGSDQRFKAKNYDDYYQRLKPDFDKFKYNKRVWLIFNTQFSTDIGDKIGEPKWYYDKGTHPTANLILEFRKTYGVVKKYETKDVTAYLFSTP